MNSIEAIISPIQKELLEFHMSVPHSQQVSLITDHHRGIFVVYLEGIFMLNLIFQYFATSLKAFISVKAELGEFILFFLRESCMKESISRVW